MSLESALVTDRKKRSAAGFSGSRLIDHARLLGDGHDGHPGAIQPEQRATPTRR